MAKKKDKIKEIGDYNKKMLDGIMAIMESKNIPKGLKELMALSKIFSLKLSNGKLLIDELSEAFNPKRKGGGNEDKRS